jgi:hypothetical protein
VDRPSQVERRRSPAPGGRRAGLGRVRRPDWRACRLNDAGKPEDLRVAKRGKPIAKLHHGAASQLAAGKLDSEEPCEIDVVNFHEPLKAFRSKPPVPQTPALPSHGWLPRNVRGSIPRPAQTRHRGDRMMRTAIIACAAGIGMAIALLGAPASAKTAKECSAEYAANKAAIQSAGQKKADFITACKAGSETIPTSAAPPTAPAPSSAATSVKTAKECDAEYAANKAAIKAAGQTKKAFVAACRSGNESIPVAPAASAPAPAAPAAAAPSPASAAPAPKPAAAPVSASEAQAQATCPGDTVVWVNMRSGIYHFKGTHNYGTTKQGTYMCEAAAKAAGDRAAENEKHP